MLTSCGHLTTHRIEVSIGEETYYLPLTIRIGFHSILRLSGSTNGTLRCSGLVSPATLKWIG
jgi:hypothetical protein